MEKSIGSKNKWLFIIFYLSLIYVYTCLIIMPILHYQIQQPSFLNNYNFFAEHLYMPGKLAEYAAKFISQFFYYNWTGTIAILGAGLLIVVLFSLVFGTIKELKGRYIPSFLFFLIYTPLFNDYCFPFETVLQVLIAIVLLYLFVILYVKKINPYILYLCIALILYYIAGSGSFMLFSICSVIIVFFKTGFKKGIVFLVLAVSLSSLVPYFLYKFIFNISLSDAYLYIVPQMPVLTKYNPGNLFWIFYCFLPFSILFLSIISAILDSLQKRNSSFLAKAGPFLSRFHVNGLVTNLILFVLISLVTIFVLKGTTNQHRKNIVLADYYNYHEQWDKTINIAQSDSEYDIFLNYYYNRAIDHYANYVDLFFNYPQLMGGDGLFPDRLVAANTVLISSDFYFDLGYISQAHHWAHEAQTALPYSPRILKRLVITNLIFENYKAAKNILVLMNDMFFYKDFVKKYMPYTEDSSLTNKDSLIIEKRSFLPVKTVVIDSYEQRMQDLLENNSNNKRAFDHLALYCLLNHRLNSFYKLVPSISKFYRSTPRIFEEGILLYLIGSKKTTNLDKISALSKNKISEFYRIFLEAGRDKQAAKAMLTNCCANTYFYYVFYTSPIVTKAGLKIKTN
jgi:hypothetical protein